MKKTIYQLRDELIDAEPHFEVLHIYGDHVVVVLMYSLTHIERKKQELKEYIERTFNAILHVDIFTQYIVIWHDFEIVAPEHTKIKRP